MIKSNDYWKKREAAEKEWQKQAEKNIQAYNQHIAQMYQNAIDEINRQIKSDLGFADNKLITAKDMQEYETLAKEAVKKANALRAKGHYVTRKDFSKDVNDRLKVYNATMRINRNEILKSKIGARLVELGIEQETDLTKKLWNDYTKEKERQAGILGITAKSDLWTSKEVQGQIYKQIATANFSKRVWADIDGLKGQLDGLVSTAIIRGDNPKTMAKWLTGMVSATIGNQRYVAERLARTETARVQFEAQQKSILDAGYKYVKWMAEGSACKLCREIAYKDNGYDENGVYKAKDVPDIPVHPNCMCSISAYWVDNNFKNSGAIRKDVQHIKDFEPLSKNEIMAQRIYLELGQRNPKNAGKLIAKAGNFSDKEGEQVFKHVFRNKHRFKNDITGKIYEDYFDPDYDMAQSFARILNRQSLLDRDIILVKHELLESTLMAKNPKLTYKEAHKLTNEKYNYEKLI